MIAKEVEARLLGGDVGDVGLVARWRRASDVVRSVTKAAAQAEETIERAHPLAVAPGEVVVGGEDVDAAAAERVQDRGRHGDERLAFAGGELRQAALVHRHARGELDVEGPYLQQPRRRFAGDGKDVGQEIVERFAGVITRARPRPELHARPSARPLDVAEVDRVDAGDRVEVRPHVVLDRRTGHVAEPFEELSRASTSGRLGHGDYTSGNPPSSPHPAIHPIAAGFAVAPCYCLALACSPASAGCHSRT